MDARSFIPCRFFVSGFCRLERSCPYLHDEPPPRYRTQLKSNSFKSSSKLCKFFLEGYCRQENSCNFSHEQNRQEIRPGPISFVKKTGKYNSAEKQIPSKKLEQPLDKQPEELPEKIQINEPGQIPEQSSEHSPEVVSKKEFDLPSDNNNCEICQNLPKVYGLLLRCNHTFCLNCLRKVKISSQIKNDAFVSLKGISCPTCNLFSACIIPSPSSFPQGGIDKQQVIEFQLLELSKIVCKHFQLSFNAASRHCPYKDECLRAHPLDQSTFDQIFYFESNETAQNNNKSNEELFESLLQKVEAQYLSWDDFTDDLAGIDA